MRRIIICAVFLLFFAIGTYLGLSTEAGPSYIEPDVTPLHRESLPYNTLPPVPAVNERSSSVCGSESISRIAHAVHRVSAARIDDPCSLAQQILYAANAHGIDPYMIVAIGQIESSWRMNVVSKAGAIGPMQLMPKTFYEMGGDDIWDWRQNIYYGAKYFAYLLYERANGDIALALMFYNAGPSRGPAVAKRLSSGYAQRVLQLYAQIHGQDRRP